jgi:hypothetical protein
VAGFDKIFVSPDLTKLQQAEDKHLRTKLKEIRDGGEKEAKISNGKIVKSVNNQLNVLYEPNA